MSAASEAPIWRYARALNKALIHIAPEDFRMEWSSFGEKQAINVACTITTEQEAEAVCEIIMHLARKSLTRYREAVRGDIYPDEPPPSWREQLERVLGPCVTLTSDSGIEARRAVTPKSVAVEDESPGSAKQKSPEIKH